jgi:hypothetical protein
MTYSKNDALVRLFAAYSNQSADDAIDALRRYHTLPRMWEKVAAEHDRIVSEALAERERRIAADICEATP